MCWSLTGCLSILHAIFCETCQLPKICRLTDFWQLILTKICKPGQNPEQKLCGVFQPLVILVSEAVIADFKQLLPVLSAVSLSKQTNRPTTSVLSEGLFPYDQKILKRSVDTCRIEIHLCQCWHSLSFMAIIWGKKHAALNVRKIIK